VNLHEVLEASIAMRHWRNGSLREWLGSDEATEDLMNAIVIIDAAYSAVEHWQMTPSKDGGGGS
jgi:hypothetical protein